MTQPQQVIVVFALPGEDANLSKWPGGRPASPYPRQSGFYDLLQGQVVYLWKRALWISQRLRRQTPPAHAQLVRGSHPMKPPSCSLEPCERVEIRHE